MTQPVAGLTLFTLMVASSLRSVLAQLPTLQPNTAQALPQNFFGQQTAYILGGGERPGSFTISLTGGAGDNPGVQYPTLGLALQQAGGVILSADISQVQVRRRLSSGGAEQVFKVNLWQLVQTGYRTEDLTLRDGDTIFIHTVNLQETRHLATINFSAALAKPLAFAVVGAVKRLGSYILLGTATNQNNPTGNGGLPTVTLAIQQDQGIKPLADIRRIDVRRLTKTAAEQVFNINLWQLLQTGNISQEAILQDGDTVVVPTATEVATAESLELATALFSPDTINISVVGEVETPGTLKVPPNTTLNQALLTAGSFKGSRARRSCVDLIRLNIDGTVSKQEVPINLAQGVNDQGNPILRENDIILVSRAGTTRITDTLRFYSIPQLQFLQCFRYWELDNDHIRTVSGVT
ncbi:MAG TPA: SLBB domain-containing protein [Candidatus Sericytochromatia bacterium]